MKATLPSWPILARRSASFAPLGASVEERAKADHLGAIQKFAGTSIGPGDVLVRGMRVVNSQRDYYFSRFALDALSEIADLLPGRPVMRAHEYRSLPIGTHFAAQRIFLAQPKQPRRDSYWVESLYFMPNDDEGQHAARRIDMRIWNEVSLGWMSLTDECLLCHEDIRDCPHIPGEVYDQGFGEYEMSGVTGVLEASQVFAGGQKGTHQFNPQQAARLLGEFMTTAQLVELKHERAMPVGTDELDNMLEKLRASNAETKRTSVQSLICSKERFDTAKDAASWVRDHSFRADKVDTTDSSYRFRQFDPASCEESSFRTIKLDDGISAVICKKASQQKCAPTAGLESLLA